MSPANGQRRVRMIIDEYTFFEQSLMNIIDNYSEKSMLSLLNLLVELLEFQLYTTKILF